MFDCAENPAAVTSLKAMEARARRRAKRADLVAVKSRWRVGSIDNFGGMQIRDPETGFVVLGVRYELDPEDVIEYFAD